ncbi:unnamed protein product [Gordionus sp. m RMFG-2023]|uniref:N-fatty-acyl-amino acid synthase/hydrolase PM20D1.2-like n=1 Tax=Gordionus sp. m RMFG-2023 TaxID=3053472 RepID=UPI0030E06417
MNGARKIALLLGNTYSYPHKGGKPIGKILFVAYLIETEDVAPVCVSEKYVMNVNISVEAIGGHSSLSGKENAISILSSAVTKVRSKEFPSFLGHPGTPDFETLKRIAHLYPQPYKIYLENVALFRNNLSLKSFTKTSAVVTSFIGGIKSNVILSYAEATINHRVHPMQDPIDSLEFDGQIIDDSRVKIIPDEVPIHSPISDYDTNAFKMIEATILGIFNETIVVPAIFMGSTDSKHFSGIVDNIYRFSPLTVTVDDISRVHGVNERISVADYHNCIKFYYNLIEQVSGFVKVPKDSKRREKIKEMK